MLDIMELLEKQFEFNANLNKKTEDVKNDYTKSDSPSSNKQSNDVQKRRAKADNKKQRGSYFQDVG